MNGDMFSEVYQYSELVGKLCPNTVVKKCTVAPLYSKKAEAKNYIIDCLTKKNTPVAMCRGGHWITIVGISDDQKQIYVSDSQQPGGTITVKDLDTATKGSLADPVEFVWTENLELDPTTKKPVLNSEILSYDEKSGAITPTDKAVLASPDTQTKGIFTGDDGVEMYVPGMVRDYTRDYRTQKEEYAKFKEANKTKLELDDEKASAAFKANKKYTYMSEFTQDKAVYKLNEDVLKDLENERRKELKEAKIFPDDVVNSMTRGEIAMQFPLELVHKNYYKTADTASKEAKKEADADAQGFSQKEIDAAIAASLADQQKEKKDFVDKDDAEDLETILNEMKDPEENKSEAKKKSEEEKLKDYHPIPQNSIIADDENFEPEADKLNSSFKETQKLNLDDEDLAEDKHSASMLDIDLFAEEEKKAKEKEQQKTAEKKEEQPKTEKKDESQPKAEEKEKEQPESELKKEEKPEAEKKAEENKDKQEDKPENEEKAPKAKSEKSEDQVDTFRRVADAFKEYRLETREITRRILAKRTAARYAVAAQNNIRKRNAALKKLGLKEDAKDLVPKAKEEPTEKINEVKPAEVKAEDVNKEVKQETNEVKKETEAKAQEVKTETEVKQEEVKKEPEEKKEEKTETEVKQEDAKPETEVKEDPAKTETEIKQEEVKTEEKKEEEKVEEKTEPENKKTEQKKEPGKKAPLNALQKQFMEKIKEVQGAEETKPGLKGMRIDALRAQLELAEAFNAAGKKVDEKCVQIAARLMTYATLDKICSLPETSNGIVKDLLKPDNINRYTAEILEKSQFAENAAKALLEDKGVRQILSLNSKDIRSTMVKELNKLTTVSKQKNVNKKLPETQKKKIEQPKNPKQSDQVVVPKNKVPSLSH